MIYGNSNSIIKIKLKENNPGALILNLFHHFKGRLLCVCMLLLVPLDY